MSVLEEEEEEEAKSHGHLKTNEDDQQTSAKEIELVTL